MLRITLSFISKGSGWRFTRVFLVSLKNNNNKNNNNNNPPHSHPLEKKKPWQGRMQGMNSKIQHCPEYNESHLQHGYLVLYKCSWESVDLPLVTHFKYCKIQRDGNALKNDTTVPILQCLFTIQQSNEARSLKLK